MNNYDLLLRRTSGGKGEGDIVIPDAWVTSRWDGRWEDWVVSRRGLTSHRLSF